MDVRLDRVVICDAAIRDDNPASISPGPVFNLIRLFMPGDGLTRDEAGGGNCDSTVFQRKDKCVGGQIDLL